MADTNRSLMIQGVNFTVADPYAEGHKCTAMEAKALNQTRAENLRNNFASKVKAAKGEDGSINDKQVAALQSELDDYAKAYVFSVGVGSRLDPVQKEAKQLAVTLVDGAIAKKGTSKAAYIEANGKDKYDELVAGVMERDDVVKEAQKIVKQRQSIADAIEV